EADVTGVYNGTFDTASTYQSSEDSNVFTRMEAKGMIEPGVICKIWTSPEITSGPWTFRDNLPEDMIAEITDAIEAFPTADPEGYKLYSSFDPEDANPAVGFYRVDKERYQWIVDMRQWIKDRRRGG
ncbi:MAG TPA: phosphonate ABC transporter substrate-binding protein, partial [Rhodobacterales bacterium]|nr:phosphonate ABC transporter substrate-binding protein [Rhodobacterales bacterium]